MEEITHANAESSMTTRHRRQREEKKASERKRDAGALTWRVCFDGITSEVSWEQLR
jgi:hypothetical protein